MAATSAAPQQHFHASRHLIELAPPCELEPSCSRQRRGSARPSRHHGRQSRTQTARTSGSRVYISMRERHQSVWLAWEAVSGAASWALKRTATVCTLTYRSADPGSVSLNADDSSDVGGGEVFFGRLV
jgi:hypothetical protein